jgi:hypothetical protein
MAAPGYVDPHTALEERARAIRDVELLIKGDRPWRLDELEAARTMPDKTTAG